MDWTEAEETAVKTAEDFLRNQTPNAKRSNKKLLGLANAVSAIYQTRGKFAHYLKPKQKANLEKIAADFFKISSQGDLDYILRYSADWR